MLSGESSDQLCYKNHKNKLYSLSILMKKIREFKNLKKY